MNIQTSITSHLSRWPWLPILSFASLAAILGVMIGIYLTAEHRLTGEFGFSLDDSWIHAAIAKNLVEGKGYGVNPGESMSSSTAPLYTILLAGGYALTGDMVLAGKMLGVLGLVAAGLFLYLAAVRLSQDRFVAWLAVALCFVSFPFLWASLSGMEITLHFASSCLALLLYTRQRYRWMTVALAAGVWLRPESILLLGLGWLAIPKRDKLATMGIAAALLVPYFALNLWLSDYLFPVTVRTKQATTGAHFTAKFLEQTFRFATNAFFVPVFVLAIPGFVVLWKKAWWAALFPLAHGLSTWATSMTAASFARYLYPALPYLFLMFALGILWTIQRKPTWAKPAKFIALLLLAMQSYRGESLAGLSGMAAANINRMQVEIGKVISQISAPDDILATNDIGAMAYFSGHRILDFDGLASPLRSFDENIRLFRPAFVTIFDAWFPQRLASPTFVQDYQLLAQVKLAQNVVCGDSVMSIHVRNDRIEEISQKLQQLGPP